MKRKHWITAALVGSVALSSAVFAQDLSYPNGAEHYTLDGTLEPEQMLTAKNVGSPDAPVMRHATDFALPSPLGTAQSLPAVSHGEIVQPPRQIRADEILSDESPYTLVQWNGKNPAPSKSQLLAVNDSSMVGSSQDEQAQRETLRKNLQQILVANNRRAVTTQQNTPADVLLMALPYGADARVFQPAQPSSQQPAAKGNEAAKGSYMYSIGTLCWNYPCMGKTLLRSDGKRIYARMGTGFQQRPASFLALLAMSNIMPDYELKVDGSVYSIANLIASEKAGISKGMNHSMALVGLSFYTNPTDKWKNDMGEDWTIEQMVIEEMNRPIDQGTSDVTDWLMGLTAAINLYEEENVPVRGPIALAKKQIQTYQEFVLSVQNDQYLWHPKFFLFRGTSSDNFETLYASGHILRWLLTSLSDKELESPKIRRTVASLAAAVNRVPTNLAAGSLNDRQLEGLAVSLQALAIYRNRVFGNDMPTSNASQQTAAMRPHTH